MATPRPIQHKLLYSKRLLEILDSKIAGYLDAKSDDAIRDEYNELSSFGSLIEGKGAPSIISLICGDVLQNLRSTLDYLVWELVIANKNVPNEHNAFPVCGCADGFKEAKKKRLRGVDADAITLIKTLQPYHFGQGNEIESPVFVLDKLANIHKHRTILLACERHAPVDAIRVVDSAGNFIGLDPLLAMDGRTTAEFLKSALEMHGKVQMAVFVEFGEGPVKGAEVISVVSGLYESVALDIIPQFNRFFA